MHLIIFFFINFIKKVENTFRSPLYWFTLILVPLTILAIDLAIKTFDEQLKI